MQVGDRVRVVNFVTARVGEVVEVRGNLVRVQWPTRGAWFTAEELICE